LLFALIVSSAAACSDGIGKPIVRGNVSGNVVTSDDGGSRVLDAGADISERKPTITFGDLPVDSRELSIDAVPDTAYCQDVRHDNFQWSAPEYVINNSIITDIRALDSPCTPDGIGRALPALTMLPSLRCAARQHSAAMAQAGSTSPVDLDDAAERAEFADFAGTVVQEIVFEGTFEEFYTALFTDHCQVLLDPTLEVVGVGFHPFSTEVEDDTAAGYYTVDLGTR
jgi:hypothetical protein